MSIKLSIDQTAAYFRYIKDQFQLKVFIPVEPKRSIIGCVSYTKRDTA